MNVLVDTSVWVAHFRLTNDVLVALIERDVILSHPLILAEITCGTPPAPRLQTLANLALLSQARTASMAEVLAFIERERLFGLGCGFVDIALLASTCMTPDTMIWTLDKRLLDLANRFGVQFVPSFH
jgi:predicted nucleic acid-binding protein